MFFSQTSTVKKVQPLSTSRPKNYWKVSLIVPLPLYIYIFLLYGCFLKWWVFPKHPHSWSFLVGKPRGCWRFPHHFGKAPYIFNINQEAANHRWGATSWIAKQTGLWIHLEPWERVGETQLKPQKRRLKRRDFVSGWCLISEAVRELGVEETHELVQRCVIDWKIIDVACKEYGKNLGPFETDNFTPNYRWFSGRKIEIIPNESPSGWNKWLST